MNGQNESIVDIVETSLDIFNIRERRSVMGIALGLIEIFAGIALLVFAVKFPLQKYFDKMIDRHLSKKYAKINAEINALRQKYDV